MFKKNKKLKSLTKPRQLVTLTDSRSIISEQFRTIRANINFSLPDEEVKTILITSSMTGEGKSTNAANLAVVFAQEGKNVLLVDADMRKPSLHFTFNIKNSIGLSNILAGKNYLKNAIHETPIDGLHIISSGPIPPNPAELLSSNNMSNFLKEIKDKYDMIIFDAPPLLAVSDSQILSNKCDGTILIICAGFSEKSSVFKAKETLKNAQAKILGVVLNNYKISRKNYKNYHYDYLINIKD